MSKMKLEYTDIEPSETGFTVNLARSMFLEAIRKYAPEVLNDLSTIHFDSLSAKCENSIVLQNWMNHWNLNANWILETAFETLQGWHQFPLFLEEKIEFSVSDIWKRRDELSLSDEFLDILEMKKIAATDEISIAKSSSLFKKFVDAGIIEKDKTKKKIKKECKLFWSFLPTIGLENPSKLPDPPKGLQIWEADSEARAFYMEGFETEMINETEIKDGFLKEGFFSDIKLPVSVKNNLKKAKREIVSTYCDEVVKAYLALKDERGNHLWTLTEKKTNLKRNAAWAVKFQVLKQTFSEIAKGENLVHTTVMREVENFLELIGVPKRETNRGRSKGYKNSILATLGK